jgi:hypothetical protein
MFLKITKNMDKKTRANFINIDKKHDHEINTKMDEEIRKRKNEHYEILDSEDYANIIKNF